jgi:hypothetical protein
MIGCSILRNFRNSLVRICLILALGGAAILAAQDTSATLSGDVRQARATVLPPIDVALKLDEPPYTLFSTQTDDEGAFKFAMLPAGTYFVAILELLPTKYHVGNLSGLVERDEAHPIAHATVQLFCDGDKVCGKTKTDSKGQFAFFNLPPRDKITIYVTHPNYYPFEAPDYEIRGGFNSVYAPITLDSRQRPKPPLVVCE